MVSKLTRLCLLVLLILVNMLLRISPAQASRTIASVSSVRPDAERINKAKALAADGKVPEAEKLLNDEIASEKEHDRLALLHFTLAVIEFRASLDDAAATHFKAALDNGTRLPDYAHFYLGLLAKKKAGDTSSARTEFTRVIDSHTSKATELDARFELAQLLMTEKQWKPAIAQLEVLRKGLRSDERYSEVIYDLIRADLNQGIRGPVCKMARELYSHYPTLAQISGASGTDGVWGPALEKNKIDGKTIGCHADPRDLKMRVRSLWLGGDDARAEAELRLLHGDPDDDDDGPVVDKLLVNHLIADGRLDEALKLLLQHYDAGKNRTGYLQLLAKTAASAGENQVAVSAYQRAFDLSPRSKDGINALFQAAFTSYQMQDYDGASRRFEQFLHVQPHSALSRDSQWYLAWIRYLRGDYQGAIDSFAQLAKSPATRVVRRRRRRRGHQNSVVAASDTVAKDRIQYWTAMSYLKMGETTQALPIFQTLARDPSIGYYSMLAYYRLLALPGSKMPADIDVRLGLKHSGAPGSVPNEEELKLAAQTATDEAQAEYEADTDASDDASEEASAADEKTEAGGEAAVAADTESTPAEAQPAANFKDPGLAIRFERARDLALVGLTDGARRELLDIERHARSMADRKVLMVEYANVQNYERSSFLGEIAFGAERLRTGLKGESRPLWEQAYPRAWESTVTTASHTTAVPEQLIWGIMRAESHYRDDARSPVGALGLMQLMPFTGKKVADLLNWKGFEPRNMLQPETNIRLGSRYLQRLGEKFGGKIPLIAASYNAGPHRVSTWIRNFGTLDMDEFIEHIPYVETRNYVKRVVRNFQMYNLLYQGDAQALKWVIQPIGVKATETTGVQEIW